MQEIENAFWNHFRDYVRHSNFHGSKFQISPEGETAIRELIAHGVGEMTRLSYSPAQWEGAKSKLLLFADEMMILAKREHTNLLTGNIFHRIKEKICPLHPFC